MSKLKISRASIMDEKLVSSLVHRLLVQLKGRRNNDFELNFQHIRKTSKRMFLRSNFAAFLAWESTDRAVGLITISEAFAIYNGGAFGVITELFVEKEFRSRGVGASLLGVARDYSMSMGWDKLEVGAPNELEWPRTKRFYKSHEFKETGPKLRLNLKK